MCSDQFKFYSKLSLHESNLWGTHFGIAAHLVEDLKNSDHKRWMCVVNAQKPLNVGLMGDGNGGLFITLNKSFCKQHGLQLGDRLRIELFPDTSEYGMDISDEFLEVLDQNKEAANYFQALTPGKRRNLIFYVGNVKSSDIKIRRAFVVCEHLVVNRGSIDFKELNAEMKAANRDARVR